MLLKKNHFFKSIPFLIAVLWLIFSMPFLLEAKQNDRPQDVGIDEHLGQTIPMNASFTDSNGSTIALRDIIGKPIVLSLVYFHCPTICMPLLGAETDVLNDIDLVPGKDYRILTISFNEKDTTESAKNIKETFIHRFNTPIADKDWLFMTGDLVNIKKLTDSLGFYFKRTGEDFIHPTALIMLSPEGKITRYFYGISYLPFEIKFGLIEASQGKMGHTMNKVLLYCFRYDPHGKRYVFDILKVTATLSLLFLSVFVFWLLFSHRKKKGDSTERTQMGSGSNVNPESSRGSKDKMSSDSTEKIETIDKISKTDK